MEYNILQKQLTWLPTQIGKLDDTYTDIVLGGMGGSALPGDALTFLDPTIRISVHRDYDLPEITTPNTLYIAVSYSGNTAETLSFAKAAQKHNFPLAIITSGGELLKFALDNNTALITIPDGLQPRNALFYFLRAISLLLGKTEIYNSLEKVSFDKDTITKSAAAFAVTIQNTIPVFYSSRVNSFLAYYAKISFNETGKTPSFTNVFPEFNHNDMQSLDTTAPKNTVETLRFVLLRDEKDDKRIIQRMNIFKELMLERGRNVLSVKLTGETRAEQLVHGVFYFERAASASSTSRSIDPNSVPLIVDFKKRL